MLVLPFLFAFRDVHFLARIWVITKIIHRRGVGHGRGREILHLVGHQPVLVGDVAEFAHLLDGASGMGGDEIGNQLLVFTAAVVFLLAYLLYRNVFYSKLSVLYWPLLHHPQHYDDLCTEPVFA